MSGIRTTFLIAITPVVLLLMVISFVVFAAEAQQQAAACGGNGPSVIVDPDTLPESVGPWNRTQLGYAAIIINAGQQLDIGLRGQTIGVMTAMGETTLRNLDRGDAAGPDSRGLFQQRDEGWGTYEDRMNPHIAATNFFRALMNLDGWESMPPTLAAHRTQVNDDPYHYEKFWDDAIAVVAALADSVVGLAPGSGGTSCSITPGAISAEGWTKPTVGPVTSGFGMRRHPISGRTRLHAGTDIGAPNDTPIYAAAGGTIVRAGPSSGYGNLIVVDHGNHIVTRYAHMYARGILVEVGQTVQAGQQIALVGSAGRSSGPHLHFEVQIAGNFTDPEPFMIAAGAPLGATP